MSDCQLINGRLPSSLSKKKQLSKKDDGASAALELVNSEAAKRFFISVCPCMLIKRVNESKMKNC